MTRPAPAAAMVARLVAGVAMVVAGASCDETAARRPAPAPGASAASRALLTEALTGAVATARAAQEHKAEAAADDIAAASADRLTVLDGEDGVSPSMTGSARDAVPGGIPHRMPDEDDDDPGGVFGGVVGGVVGSDLLAPAPPLPPAARITDEITAVPLGDVDELDAGALDRQLTRLRLRAQLCRRQATGLGALTGTVNAIITLRRRGNGPGEVRVDGAGPLTSCLERLVTHADIPARTTLSVQLTIPPM